jgi:hypothetical protein
VYAVATVAVAYWHSHYLKATNFGFSIPSGATINGILVEIEKKANGYHGYDDNVKIVKADGTLGTTNKADNSNLWEITDTYHSYGSSSNLWGETWDDTKINDVDFGVAISARNNTNGLGNTLSVDHIRITVTYTASASASISNIQSITNIISLTL